MRRVTELTYCIGDGQFNREPEEGARLKETWLALPYDPGLLREETRRGNETSQVS